MFLRDYEEKDSENFWLILIGCQADENFPVIGKEYKIVVQNQIDLGNIYNSFYWSGELRDFYSGNPEFGSYGIAGLSVPPSHDEFIPLDGSLQFLKGDSKAGEYSEDITDVHMDSLLIYQKQISHGEMLNNLIRSGNGKFYLDLSVEDAEKLGISLSVYENSLKQIEETTP